MNIWIKGKNIRKYLKTYLSFLNEIKVNPKPVLYNVQTKKSDIYTGCQDYVLNFNINEHGYLIILIYYKTHVEEKIFTSYNLLLTTKENYDEYRKEIDKIKKLKNGIISIDDHKMLSTIVERQTEYNEIFKLVSYISYILQSFTRIKGYPLSLTDTINDPRKIKFYRNIIKNSFKNVKETEDLDDGGNKIYYYQEILQ